MYFVFLFFYKNEINITNKKKKDIVLPYDDVVSRQGKRKKVKARRSRAW